MVRAKITSKGQVTLPVVVRRRYRLEPGDEIAFRMDQGGLRLVPVRKRPLTEFHGAFPAAQPHPGRDAIRGEVGRMLAEELEHKLRRR
jgi:AbrB family looped-hinge helix DNA binding protein